MFDSLMPQPLDPANALLGFVVSSLGQAVLSGATRAILGNRTERALRNAFNSAIEAAADEMTASPAQSSALQGALRRPSRELARPERFGDLPELVSAWLEEVYASTPPAWLVAEGATGRQRLAAALHAQITQAVIADGLQGGPLQPLAEHVNFQRVFGLSDEILQQMRPIREMLEELLRLLRQQTERNDPPDPATAGARTLIDDREATFTGRDNLCLDIDRYVGSPDFSSGYLFIIGEPGIGKTSLLAHLVAQRNYIYHFNSRRQGITSAQEFLNSVCWQLAFRYHLESVWPANVPPTSATLSALLAAAAQKAGSRAPLVIAVDALDESEPASGGANRLLLPPVLPRNVYFLVTSRPLASSQLSVEQSRSIMIAEGGDENLTDIRRYIIDRELEGPFSGDFAERIAAWGVTQDYFVDTLVQKSQGNFMYVVHMLASIRLDALSEDALADIRRLPSGLFGYYEMHWEVMKRRWQPSLWQKHENAVRCLALMKTPVSPVMLIQLAGKNNLPDVDESLVSRVFSDWREFLVEDRKYRDSRFYIYHDTFSEFLATVGPTLGPMAQAMEQNQMSLLRQILDGA